MTRAIPTRLDPAAYRRTPWKNGGGVTIDIADAYRPGTPPGSWDGMIWRFGRARIEQPGPFSDLSGFDRCLAVIDGKGLLLHPEGEATLDARRPFHPVRFPGEWRITSELTAGPVGVLNLLADRTRARIEMILQAEPGRLTLPAGISLLYAPSNPVSLTIAGESCALGVDHTLRLDLAEPIEARLDSGILALASVRLL